MRHWLTRADMRLRKGTIKRFDPSHWMVDFPRGTVASVVSSPGEDRLTLTAVIGRKNDLVGLIYRSDDNGMHVGHRRDTSRDYSHCTLRFRWSSAGLKVLDAIDGPTLTIEGRDRQGVGRTWYVRLWNYAVGSNADAVITLPFDDLRAGFQLTPTSERVEVTDIDRVFISVVAPSYSAQDPGLHPEPVVGSVEMSEISCSGAGSVVEINDAFVPEHSYRICTGYDDCYHLSPERVVASMERLGYRGIINHYVGMSHYMALDGSGSIDRTKPLNLATRRWHESFAALARQAGYDIIWSLSMEVLDQFCPEHWKQRAWDGQAARTGYLPPSTLLSPAVTEAFDYLSDVAAAFVGIGVDAGLRPWLQIGEPWWWVNADQAICLYDPAADALWPAAHQKIQDVRQVSAEQNDLLAMAGTVLSNATARITDHVAALYPALKTHLLVYLPSIYRSDAPNVARANLPNGWQKPAFDVLQLEDYEWVSSGLVTARKVAQMAARTRLNYPLEDCHYLSGFVATADDIEQWNEVLAAAEAAERDGFQEVLIWALPQVLRDSVTIFEGGNSVDAFRDVTFPLEIGLQAIVEPCFSTAITTSSGGFEYRNVNWQQARMRFDVGPGVRSLETLKELLRFFRSMRGNAIAFRFRDSTDYSSSGTSDAPTAGDVKLGVGNGQTRLFPLIKRYGEGEVRRITRPVSTSIVVALDGVSTSGWSLLDGGMIEFVDPPPSGAVVTAGFLFDVPVRFAEESLKVSQNTYQAGKLASVPLIEVREG